MLKERWDKDYITKDTLKGWVVLNEKRAGKGITAEEYKEITGEEYEASEE
ncbi:XkdX family protein [Roseburia sp. OM02-15]|nr:XkdX family protein [Roseburia sp. OM02-15]